MSIDGEKFDAIVEEFKKAGIDAQHLSLLFMAGASSRVFDIMIVRELEFRCLVCGKMLGPNWFEESGFRAHICKKCRKPILLKYVHEFISDINSCLESEGLKNDNQD